MRTATVTAVAAGVAAAAGWAAVAWRAWRGGGEVVSEASPPPAPGRSLGGFVLERVVSESRAGKTLAVVGHWRGRRELGRALLVLEKKPFAAEGAALEALFRPGAALVPELENPPYGYYSAALGGAQAGVSVSVVFPCTERHIRKHTRGRDAMLRETPAVYAERHEPGIPPAEHTGWVDAILAGDKEADRVLARDACPETGYVLLPDSRWTDEARTDDMYLLALCRRPGVRSLRDLRGEHLPLLRSLRRGCLETARERYGHAEHGVQLYVHYPPSYYHLHVHAVATSRPVHNDNAGRAHLLDDVIARLERDPEHYARATLTLRVGEHHFLAPAARGEPLPV